MIALNTNLHLQLLSAKDADILSAVAIRAYRDHYLYLWEDEGENYIAQVFNPDFLRDDLRHENYRYWLVWWEKNPVGFLKVKLDEPWENETKALELERIYLTQAAANQGIGQILMKFVFDLAHDYQKNIVWLKVMDSSQSAIVFYEKMGFVKCGTHHLNLPFMKEEYCGMYVMKKILKIA